MNNRIIDYIESHWNDVIRENHQDNGTLIGLPYPYTVPAVGFFDEIYYWDTYFTNKGLEISGRWDLVKSNTDNMLYLVDKYGFMPNGNRTYYLNNSQPPFLSLMVRDVFEHYGDPTWLTNAYRVLCKEYKFWMTERITPIGLNQYGGHWPDDRVPEMAEAFVGRTGVRPEGKTDREIADHYITCAESGLDINPRWGFESSDYVMPDLNSLLYMFEQNMVNFAKTLGNGDEATWIAAAEKRRARMLKYMDNGGVFYDYNFKTNNFGNVFSCASVYPLFAEMVNKSYAENFLKNLGKLEEEYGISYCEKTDIDGTYQWGYPMGWACMQYLVVKSLDNYGYGKVAARIAERYLSLVEKVFDETGNLWEKYNVSDGSTNVAAEYEMPHMMGWTAGVYLALNRYLENGEI